MGKAYDRDPSDPHGSLTSAVLSDIILTLQMVEILIFWEGILTVNVNGRVGILTDKSVLHQNSLGQPVRGGGSIHVVITYPTHLFYIHAMITLLRSHLWQ